MEGRWIEAPLVMDSRGLGILGATTGLEIFADLSETGGEGGVGVSESPDEERVFAGGVSNEGDDVLVVVGDSSDRGEAEMDTGWSLRYCSDRIEACRAFRSFSLVMSVSIFKSESSSFSLCASIRRLSRSCSPVRTSSSSSTLRSMV